MNNNQKYSRKHYLHLITILTLLLIILFIISFTIGRYTISVNNLINTIYKLILNKADINTTFFKIIFYVRMPRIILAIFVGAALSVSGVIYQSLFQNPMASPDILGCSNGAATGAAIAILLNFSKYSITLSAFLFSLLSIFLVYIIGNRANGNRIINLILAGIMISSIFSAITSTIKLIADPANKLPEITYWLMGSLSGITNTEIPYAIIPIIISLILTYLLKWKLNILSLGKEEATSLGINVKLYRLLFIILATILTATSISFSGTIGYVGLVIPHLSRKLVGNNNNYLIPTSMILGSFFLLLTDNLSRILFATEIPIGILTSIIGAPFFLYLICRKEGHECSM